MSQGDDLGTGGSASPEPSEKKVRKRRRPSDPGDKPHVCDWEGSVLLSFVGLVRGLRQDTGAERGTVASTICLDIVSITKHRPFTRATGVQRRSSAPTSSSGTSNVTKSVRPKTTKPLAPVNVSLKPRGSPPGLRQTCRASRSSRSLNLRLSRPSCSPYTQRTALPTTERRTFLRQDSGSQLCRIENLSSIRALVRCLRLHQRQMEIRRLSTQSSHLISHNLIRPRQVQIRTGSINLRYSRRTGTSSIRPKSRLLSLPIRLKFPCRASRPCLPSRRFPRTHIPRLMEAIKAHTISKRAALQETCLFPRKQSRLFLQAQRQRPTAPLRQLFQLQ